MHVEFVLLKWLKPRKVPVLCTYCPSTHPESGDHSWNELKDSQIEAPAVALSHTTGQREGGQTPEGKATSAAAPVHQLPHACALCSRARGLWSRRTAPPSPPGVSGSYSPAQGTAAAEAGRGPGGAHSYCRRAGIQTSARSALRPKRRGTG